MNRRGAFMLGAGVTLATQAAAAAAWAIDRERLRREQCRAVLAAHASVLDGYLGARVGSRP